MWPNYYNFKIATSLFILSFIVSEYLKYERYFGQKKFQGLDQNCSGARKFNKSKIISNPHLALLLKDCEDLYLGDIKDIFIGHLPKLRKLF